MIITSLPFAATAAAMILMPPAHTDDFDPGTVEDRAALFDHLVQTTLQADAFASLPEHPYYKTDPEAGVIAEMNRYRDELLAANTAEQMWFALWKISNARKDTHLTVRTVDGGLELPAHLTRRVEAPIAFAVDYADLDDRFFFVSDMAVDIEDHVTGPTPTIGDRLVMINDRSVDHYIRDIRPYYRYSTENNFWWRLANDIHRTRDYIPHHEFYDADLNAISFVLERSNGVPYRLQVPYMNRRDIQWRGTSDRTYPGFSRIDELSQHDTFDLYLPDDASLPVVLLQWHGFRPDLPDAMDALMAYAEANNLLDHHVIVDATRSGGGSRGAYAVQRLQPQPFRTTFGNLKVSDIMQRWVADRTRIVRSQLGRYRETVDGGAWLLDWLQTDVQRAIEQGDDYTNNVPFKLAHLPKDSDGIVQPAPVHFRGKLTVWLSCSSGSHLDQFASQVADNNLGHIMGMPAGGFSNTWQATETLRFPTTGQPIVTYQWSLGHSLRPNGEILQYNPAPVDEYIPQTRDNYLDYHSDLLDRTLQRLGLPRGAR